MFYIFEFNVNIAIHNVHSSLSYYTVIGLHACSSSTYAHSYVYAITFAVLLSQDVPPSSGIFVFERLN